VDNLPPSDPDDDGRDAGAGRAGEPSDHERDDGVGDQPDGSVDAPVDGAAAGTDGEVPLDDGIDEGRDPLRFNNWRRRSTAGVLMTGIAVGLQKALELPRQQPAFVIEASDEPVPDGPIELKFDPDDPSATVAIIRRPASDDG